MYKELNENKLPQCLFKNISSQENHGQATRHVTIAISGFLSQADNSEKSWNQLYEALKYSKTSVFAYSWDSLYVKDLLKTLAVMTAKIGFDIALTLYTGGEYSILNYMLLAKHVKDVISLFGDAKKAAKFAG